MKKILSAALAMSLAVSMMAFSASAASATDLSAMSVEQIANLDIYSASPQIQEAILAARAEIIFGDQAWSLNGDGYVVDLKTGEATQVPKFEDLFPDWEVPVLENNDQKVLSFTPYTEIIFGDQAWSLNGDGYVVDLTTGEATQVPKFEDLFPGWEVPVLINIGQQVLSFASRAVQTSNDIFNGNVKLNIFSRTELGTEVVTFNGTGSTVGAFAKSGPVDAKYGIRVLAGDRAVGWYPNLSVNEGVKFETSKYFNYSVHASAWNEQSVEWYRMVVTEQLDAYEKDGIIWNKIP